MKQTGLPSQYLYIAQDLAQRIIRGDFPEGSRMFGRSVLASEYNVSPETIRRALRLLGDMKVVDIIPQSGVIVLSVDSAQRYIANFKESLERKQIWQELKDTLEQSQLLNQRAEDLLFSLSKEQNQVHSAQEALPNYEVSVPAQSSIIGKSIGEVNFWQATGSTIAAIRRGSSLLVSPGPYAQLYEQDVLILVGTPQAAAAAQHLITTTGG